MFERKRATEATAVRPAAARGGISGGAVMTGVVVAFGAMFLLSALIGGLLAAIGVETDITSGEAVEAGIGVGIAFVIAQLLAYMWGGYTAARMGRGAGIAHGLLVPVIAVVLAIVTGAVVASLGATANLSIPFTDFRVPIENDYLVDWGIGVAVVALIAMFVGAAIGGARGERWHTKLERDSLEEGSVEDPDGIRSHQPIASRSATNGTTTSDGTIDLTGRPTARTYR